MKKIILTLAILAVMICSVSFAVSAESDYFATPSVSSLSLHSYPNKTVYGAFEQLDTTGLSLRALFNDGTERIITGQEIRVSYSRDNCFRVGDDSVMLSYGGKSVYLPVTVNRIAYDLTALSLNGFTTTYNGAFQSYNRPLSQIVGLDGIPLTVNTSGGGINAGVYDVSIDFHTESRDYFTPESRVVTMTIEPARADIVWEELSFVYDGKSKLPKAHYVDVNGALVYPTVSGAATNAGVGYQARAAANDLNYEFTNTTATFEIKKADYDFSSVVWSKDSFIYDGSKKSISLSGLPAGVSIIGYTGDRGSDAGIYTATAMLRWDEINYNTPETLTHTWEIKKADYNMSGVSFVGKSYVFDGQMHYPELVGSMPTGADGIRLEYSFSDGACHVLDGTVSVVISFYTSSKNYNIPTDCYASVSITPLGIDVSWGELSLSYNGEVQTPTAHSDKCLITVSGGEVNAGKYLATATTENTDYYIKNDKAEFSITKAENRWTVIPADSICYEGREIKLIGESMFGEIIIKYYSDPECKNEISPPTSCGKYYATLSVDDTANFDGLSSQIISFDIVEIVAVSFLGAITKTDIKAFEKLTELDFVCSVLNNDGSVTVIDSSLVDVIYENGDSFRKSDSKIKLVYGKFTLSLPIEVGYADYDLSAVRWRDVTQTYDGEIKHPTLSGLPEGVTVLEYLGDNTVNAGTYKVYVKLRYDSENYNEPTVLPCDFTIEKCPVKTPLITGVYNGEWQMPLSDSDLYNINTVEKYLGAGSYVISVSLTDPDNYVFAEGGGDVANAIFKILPATLYVRVSDVSLRLFEELSDVEYIVTSGTVYEGDTLTVSAYADKGEVMLRSENPNYIFEVTPGRINRLPYPTPEGGMVMACCFVLFILIVFLALSAYKNRHRLASAAAMMKCRWHNRSFKADAPKAHAPFNLKYDLNSFDPIDSAEAAEPEAEVQERERDEIEEDNISTEEESPDVDFEVDAEKADTLISDSLAKSLIKREGEMVFTSGSEKGIVNIDVLNKNFASGERVDINSLKEKGILGEDVAYYKVLAGGKINKPLSVYANDFSLTAVKMIALTGGEAIKIVTFKDKTKNEKDKNT